MNTMYSGKMNDFLMQLLTLQLLYKSLRQKDPILQNFPKNFDLNFNLLNFDAIPSGTKELSKAGVLDILNLVFLSEKCRFLKLLHHSECCVAQKGKWATGSRGTAICNCKKF